MTKPEFFHSRRVLTTSSLAIATALIVALSSMQFSAVAAVDSAPKVILDVENTSQSTYVTDRVRNETPVGDKLFFVRDHASDDYGTAELWVSDGTVAGTTLLKQIQRDDDLDDSTAAVGELLYFFQAFQDDISSSTVRYELWKSDGTSIGTVKVKDFESLAFSPENLRSTSVRLFFRNDIDSKIWTSDGSSAVEVESLAIDLSGSTAVVGETLFFEGTDERLWKTTDGTNAGTTVVATTSTSVGRGGVGEIEAVGDWIYYEFDVGTSADLWRSNGAEGPGERLTTGHLSPEYLTRVGDAVYFLSNAQTELWFSNGNLVREVYLDNSGDEITNPTAVGDSLFFTKGDSDQLWITSESSDTASPVYDASASNDQLEGMTAVEDNLFFSLADGANSGTLWSSDGTEASQIVSASEAIGSVNSSSITEAEGILYFTTNVGGARKLWSFNLNSPAPTGGGSYSAPVLPSVSLQTKVVRFQDFTSNSSVLSKKARVGLTKAIKKFTAVNSVVCTGYTSGVRETASQRKLALDRARLACKVARKLTPDAVVKLQADPARGTGAKFRAVRVKITGN